MWITDNPEYIEQHAVGFSGVLFTLAVIECHGSNVPYRSIFGFIRVPTKMYPWALLVVLSVSRSDVLYNSLRYDAEAGFVVDSYLNSRMVSVFARPTSRLQDPSFEAGNGHHGI